MAPAVAPPALLAKPGAVVALALDGEEYTPATVGAPLVCAPNAGAPYELFATTLSLRANSDVEFEELAPQLNSNTQEDKPIAQTKVNAAFFNARIVFSFNKYPTKNQRGCKNTNLTYQS
jgi:hypothetical protein